MSNKIVITKLIPPGCTKEAIVSGVIEQDKLNEVYLEETGNDSVRNQIYVGKVQNIVKNINAAFIAFEKDCIGYYPLEELPTAIFTNKQGKKPLVIGDELLVQVAKEPVKTKAAVLTTNLNLPGKYFVITTGKQGIGLSNKLSVGNKTRLKALVEACIRETASFSYGVIVRTNAAGADEEQLLNELKYLVKKADELIENAKYRTAFSKMTPSGKEYLTLVRNAYGNQMEQVVTDCPDIYEKLSEYFETEQPQDADRLIFYEDRLFPLKKLYNLELQLEHGCRRQVWLKSGAYLIIEQTEACTVIDVNTGKYDGKKDKKDTFLKINIEAAKEAARQMRLRNLSGMILVDFINMTHEVDNRILMQQFAQFVSCDRVKTVVVDMTALGIVEVTRKKERSCLTELLNIFK